MAMVTYNTKRVHFKYDECASEKQRAFVESLIVAKQGEAAQSDESVVRRFWEAAALPDDLTKWEASGLIDRLKENDARRFIEREVSYALQARTSGSGIEKGRITSADTALSVLALESAIAALLS